MTIFEGLRKAFLHCAYNKGMWEAMWEDADITSRLYKKIYKRKIAIYNLVIAECYFLIAMLKKEGRLDEHN